MPLSLGEPQQGGESHTTRRWGVDRTHRRGAMCERTVEWAVAWLGSWDSFGFRLERCRERSRAACIWRVVISSRSSERRAVRVALDVRGRTGMALPSREHTPPRAIA